MGWLAYIFGGIWHQILEIWASAEATVIFLSVIGAFIGVTMANRITKRRTTIEYLMHLSWDRDFIAARKSFTTLAKQPDGLVKSYELTIPVAPNRTSRRRSAANQKAYEDAVSQNAQVLQILNHYEQIAIGIREGILDESIYRRWFQTGFVRDWEVASELVARIRRDIRNTLFMEFEELANRWRNEGPLKRSTRYIRLFGRHITISRSR